ncbi:hypothetical protein MRB53_004011 [Persea americana]|uniref:Uncharacterized protein n=1 Tax=Persea americana TaxID=3435 RepID=A0ACC2MZN0_PERAE|nr:hypothetical protein MRB53_004011 [Persea americana]
MAPLSCSLGEHELWACEWHVWNSFGGPPKRSPFRLLSLYNLIIVGCHLPRLLRPFPSFLLSLSRSTLSIICSLPLAIASCPLSTAPPSIKRARALHPFEISEPPEICALCPVTMNLRRSNMNRSGLGGSLYFLLLSRSLMGRAADLWWFGDLRWAQSTGAFYAGRRSGEWTTCDRKEESADDGKGKSREGEEKTERSKGDGDDDGA